MPPKKNTTPAEPEVAEAISLRGLMSTQIAALIAEGQVSQEDAEDFVAQRAIGKLHKAQS